MAFHSMSVLSLVLLCVIAAAIHSTHAVDYETINTVQTAGGARFNNEIGADYAKKALTSATNFIWRVLQLTADSDRKAVEKVTLFVDNMDEVSYAKTNEVHVSAKYIESYSGDVKKEITGLLYHELTHIWQWNGIGQTPEGLTEGIADFVRLKAGYEPTNWVKAGEGDKWDQGNNGVTAKFLDYCNSLRNGFVAELNKKMRNTYSDSFFVELLGKTVDQLWKDYKAKYGQ